jgi:hypothetical protein
MEDTLNWILIGLSNKNFINGNTKWSREDF